MEGGVKFGAVRKSDHLPAGGINPTSEPSLIYPLSHKKLPFMWRCMYVRASFTLCEWVCVNLGVCVCVYIWLVGSVCLSLCVYVCEVCLS